MTKLSRPYPFDLMDTVNETMTVLYGTLQEHVRVLDTIKHKRNLFKKTRVGHFNHALHTLNAINPTGDWYYTPEYSEIPQSLADVCTRSITAFIEKYQYEPNETELIHYVRNTVIPQHLQNLSECTLICSELKNNRCDKKKLSQKLQLILCDNDFYWDMIDTSDSYAPYLIDMANAIRHSYHM